MWECIEYHFLFTFFCNKIYRTTFSDSSLSTLTLSLFPWCVNWINTISQDIHCNCSFQRLEATSFAHFQLIVVLYTFSLHSKQTKLRASFHCQVFPSVFPACQGATFPLIARGICRDASASLSCHLANIIALWQTLHDLAPVSPRNPTMSKSSSWQGIVYGHEGREWVWVAPSYVGATN